MHGLLILQAFCFGRGYPDDTIEHPTVKKSPYKGIDNSTLPAAGVTPKVRADRFFILAMTFQVLAGRLSA